MAIKIAVTVSGRVDKLVRSHLHYAKIGDVFKLFRQGDIKLDGTKVKGNERAETGSEIVVFANEDWLRKRGLEKKEKDTAEAVSDRFSVLYEDSFLLVCNKPSGTAVYEGKGVKKGTSLLEQAKHYGKSQEPSYEPQLIHRLDAETSGVLLLTKSDTYMEKMVNLFRESAIDKTYVALCHGKLRQREGTIKAALKRRSTQSKGLTVEVDARGKEAVSHYRVLKEFRNTTLIEVKIVTGRTHQIRTHMAHIGHPLVGDQRYGDAQKDYRALKGKEKRLYLHARSIGYSDPMNGKKRFFDAPVPKSFHF